MKVLIFNRAFFYLSETFIYQQVKGMPPDITVDLLGFTFVNENVFPTNNNKIGIKRADNFFDRISLSVLKNIFRIRTRLGSFSRIKLRKILNEIRPDLIHAHFGFNALLVYP